MKKKVLGLVLFLLLLIPLAFRFWGYNSLKNPFEEMYYSEISPFKVLNLPDLSDVIGSDNHYIPNQMDVTILNYQDKFLENGDAVSIFLTDNRGGLVFLYRFQLETDLYLGINYYYDFSSKTLTQEIDIYNPTDVKKHITSSREILAELKKYGKDLTWLEATSQKVLDDYILGIWFKGGSHRYSLEHLGELKIEYAAVLGEHR